MGSNKKNYPQLFNEQVVREWMSVFDQWFEDPFGQLFAVPIRVDVYDKGNNVIVEADVPGVKKEQIELEWFSDGLKIATVNRSETEETNEKEKYYRKERHFNRRERFVPLPLAGSPQNIKAKYEDGILRVVIPKNNLKQTERKRIDIE